jgi:hypothetical protein
MLSSRPTILRAIGALLFIIGGGSLTLMSLVGAAPSLWYFLCFCALPIIGIIWIWRPPLAAALSIGPLVAVGALLRYVFGMWAFSRVWAASVTVGLAAAIVLVVIALRGFRSWRLPVIVSLAFVSSAFATDHLFTNKMTVRTHQMYVAVNGHAPWGDVVHNGRMVRYLSCSTVVSGTVTATTRSSRKNCASALRQRTVTLSPWSTTSSAISAKSAAIKCGQ